MKIAAVCCTYLRPRQLGRLVQCFLRQDYPAERRELVILDDAGQYNDQRGSGWRLVSVDRRFPSLGEKRNAAAALVSADVDALAPWDDDDQYLPWALSASVAALELAPWSRPSEVLSPQPDGRLVRRKTGGLWHASWAYTREAFDRVGGYPAINNGEDQALARRLEKVATAQADPIALGFPPFFLWSWGGGRSSWHLSALGQAGYEKLARLTVEKAELIITDPP